MRREIATLALLAATACGSVSLSKEAKEMRKSDPARFNQVSNIAQSVRVTQNPEVTRGCKFLASVRSEGHATRSTFDLRFKTAALGGNTVYSNNLKAGREIFGDAYHCTDQH